jgi:hypothetical protein
MAVLWWTAAGMSTAPGSASPGADTLRVMAAMLQPRAAHTMTPVRDGNVLILGGFTGDESQVAGAEIFLGTTDRFQSIGAPRVLRHSHTATRLNDGRVLIAGGYGEGNRYLDAAELYDPATRTFTLVGRMTVARADHEAVLLDDGRVLIVGGAGTGWTFLASAELFDPRTGTFTATGSMGEARESHVTAKLPGGRVLVAGGHRGRGSALQLLRTAEIYDVATGRFRPTGAMITRRHKHDAVALPDGQVLVLGGADERDDQGVYRSVELFDPTIERFRGGRPMLLGRYKHRGTSFVVGGGMVLLAGGAPQAELYDPITGASALIGGTARMAGQFSAAARLPSGRVLVTGGYGAGRGPRASAWSIDPAVR